MLISHIFCNQFLLNEDLLYSFLQELVTKVFQQMWFTPLKGEENSDILVKRVVHMTDVVSLHILKNSDYILVNKYLWCM